MTKPPVKELPDAEHLHDLFILDEELGILFYRKRPRGAFKSQQAFSAWNTKYAGKRAGTTNRRRGYTYITIGHALFLAHRIIFVMCNGPISIDVEIDHIDRNPRNNRPDNLRLATQLESSRNTGIAHTNSTGFKGVSRSRSGNFYVRIRINGAVRYYGTYATPEEAGAVREAVAREAHGEYYRPEPKIQGRTNELAPRPIVKIRGKLTAETRAKIGAANRGRKRSLESIEKTAAANRARKREPLSPEQRKKIADTARGRTLSLEHRKRISDTQRARASAPDIRAKLLDRLDLARTARASMELKAPPRGPNGQFAKRDVP